MRKIEKLVLKKKIDQSDILKKKQLKHLMGGKKDYPYCCCFCTWNGETYCGYCGVGDPGSCQDQLNGGDWGDAGCHCSCV